MAFVDRCRFPLLFLFSLALVATYGVARPLPAAALGSSLLYRVEVAACLWGILIGVTYALARWLRHRGRGRASGA